MAHSDDLRVIVEENLKAMDTITAKNIEFRLYIKTELSTL